MTTRRTEADEFFGSFKERSPAKELEKLQAQVDQLKAERLKMKHALAEEKLAYLITSSFADVIQDPRKQKAVDMTQIQNQIVGQMIAASESRCVQELISTYRLTGCTAFTFQDKYTGIRFDTFYNRRYYEPYYIFIPKRKRSVIERHTLPPFIPVQRLEKEFLPHDLQTLIRIVQDLLLAFVARREQMKELDAFEKRPSMTVETGSIPKPFVKILTPYEEDRKLLVEVIYKNLASQYPEDVKVKLTDPINLSHKFAHKNEVIQTFKTKSLLEAYQDLCNIISSSN